MKTILLALIFVLSAFTFASAQSHHHQFEPVSNEIKSRFESRQKQIIEELASLQNNKWAGAYWAQLNSIDGASFYWSPVSGFAVRSGNDFHRGVERVNFGSANFNGNLLTLSPQYTEKNKHNYAISTSFLPLRWGQQHWLIPFDELILFIYAVNSGDYEEIYTFFVKYEDIKKPNEGLPDVPREYRKYLNRKPIKAKVLSTKVDNSALLGNEFTLNVGKAEGVIKGMKFYLVKVKDIYLKLEVTDVEKHKSTTRIVLIGSSGNYNKEIKPVGWEFSSKFPLDY